MPSRRIQSLVRAKARGIPVLAHRQHRSKRGRSPNYWALKEQRQFKRERENKRITTETRLAKDLLLNSRFNFSEPDFGELVESRNRNLT